MVRVFMVLETKTIPSLAITKYLTFLILVEFVYCAVRNLTL